MYEITPELKKKIIVLVKFSNSLDNLKSLQQGNLYLNTLEFFRNQEIKLMKKGMGDDFEGRFILNDLNLKFYDNMNGNLILEGKANQSSITNQEDSEKHVLCTSYIDFSNLEIVQEKKESFTANIIFSDEEIKEFRENFGKYALVISLSDFKKNLEKNFRNQGIEAVSDKISYNDFFKNHTNRIEPFINNTYEKYFWKDLYFKNQKEYRIIILNKDSKEPIIINIDDMSSYSFLTTASELFENRFIIESYFDPKKDLVELE